MGKTLLTSRWWRSVIAVSVIVIVALSYLFILRNWVDPRPIGRLQDERPLSLVEIPAHSQQTVWQDGSVPAAAYTVILTAASHNGEQDIDYGVAMGDDQTYLQVTISPLGYAAVTRVSPLGVEHLRTMAPFPHVRGGAESNEFWLIVDPSAAVTIRLNREVLWQGQFAVPSPAAVALVGESYGETAVIDFQQLQIFYDLPSP